MRELNVFTRGNEMKSPADILKRVKIMNLSESSVVLSGLAAYFSNNMEVMDKIKEIAEEIDNGVYGDLSIDLPVVAAIDVCNKIKDKEQDIYIKYKPQQEVSIMTLMGAYIESRHMLMEEFEIREDQLSQTPEIKNDNWNLNYPGNTGVIPTATPHMIIEKCDNPDCNGSCNECTLAICSVCREAEGGLTTHCPGRDRHPAGLSAFDSLVDYRYGMWWEGVTNSQFVGSESVLKKEAEFLNWARGVNLPAEELKRWEDRLEVMTKKWHAKNNL